MHNYKTNIFLLNLQYNIYNVIANHKFEIRKKYLVYFPLNKGKSCKKLFDPKLFIYRNFVFQYWYCWGWGH